MTDNQLTKAHERAKTSKATLESEDAVRFLQKVVEKEKRHFQSIFLRKLNENEYWNCIQAKRIERIVKGQYPDSEVSRRDLIEAMLNYYVELK